MSATAAYKERTALLGMTIFLASWAMLFAALFFSYGVVRVNAHVWPPADQPRLPLGLPALATVVLAGASAVLERARRGRAALGTLLVAAALGVAFLTLQTRVWTALFAAGLRPDAGGAYASVFWGFTVFHALHVVVGLGGLGYLLVHRSATALRLWTIYWHLVGVVWALMYLTIYVL
jgi:heme/copper-type cytochrome/quinol oxidase subunit 3